MNNPVKKINRKIESRKLALRTRKFEGMSSDDREIGKRLDALCQRHSEREFETVKDACRALKAIEHDARKLGFDFKVNNKTVDMFCDSIELEGDEYLEIMWIDGEPGDSYCLVVREYDDDDDRLELAGDFYFDEM